MLRISEDTCCDDIPVSVRAVVELIRAGVNPVDFQDYVRADTQELSLILKQLSSGKYKGLQEAGVPRSSAVKILKPIKCPECRSSINVVPCLSCSEHHEVDDQDEDDLVLSECSIPTDALPGTIEKLEVMRSRLEAGLSVFCKGDASWPVGRAS